MRKLLVAALVFIGSLNGTTLRGHLTTETTTVYNDTMQQYVTRGPLDMTFLYQSKDLFNDYSHPIAVEHFSLGGEAIVPTELHLYPGTGDSIDGQAWDGVVAQGIASNGDAISLGYPMELGSLFGSLNACPGQVVYQGVEPGCGSIQEAIGLHHTILMADGSEIGDHVVLEVSLVSSEAPEPSTVGIFGAAGMLTLAFQVRRRRGAAH
jgi:hypothetical protein